VTIGTNRKNELMLMIMLHSFLPAALLLTLGSSEGGLYGTSLEVPSPTTVEIGDERYGAEADERGPIGGGASYRPVLSGGDRVATTLDELIAALAETQPGEVVFVPGDVKIDCTARIFVDELVLEIGERVTLASDRGRDGSPGALIFSDALATRPLIRVTGPDARISGLRLRGPDPERRLDHHRRSFREGRGREYYYEFPVSDGIECSFDRLEVDNCELAGWSHAAIWLKGGTDHHVHHDFIHHNQYQGLGYGVCHDVSTSLIERNLFDWNRHSIAGTGRPGSGYEATHNIERGTSLSHCFDMHGGRDRKDGTNVAGTWLKVSRNTFLCPREAVRVRGEPEEEARVTGNWFVHDSPARAVRGEKRTILGRNAYGLEDPEVLTGD